MSNLIVCEPTLSDEGTIYDATTEAAAAPADNLQLMQPKEIYETTTVAGNMDFYIDLGTSASYDTFALLFTNATSAAQWQIANHTSPTGAGFDSSVLLAATTLRAAGQAATDRTRWHAFYQHASTQTKRYVRFRITDAANPDSVFRAGRLYVCKAYSPTVNASYGLTMGFDDIALAQVMTSAGERILRRNEAVPVLNFSLTANGSSAWAEVQDSIFEVFRKRGGSRDVMVVVDPGDTSYVGRLIHYGTLQPRLSIALPAYQLYQASYELTGLI